MATNAVLNLNSLIDLNNQEDINTMKHATKAIRSEFIACYNKAAKNEEDLSGIYEKILHLTNMSLKMYAKSHYKATAYLENLDIDQIKASLQNYANDNEKINEFKKAIIEDLSMFQKKKKESHIQKIVELNKQKQLLEKQIRIWDFEKNKLIAERLSKIMWPYDSKTKEYETKIETTQGQLKIIGEKIENLQQTRPTANEKDILLYQMHLKEKFANTK